jgi:murein DD-endopeptidase MepM/ murein hydrolase activator NlpD
VHVAAVRQVGTQDTGGGGSDLFVAQYRQYMSGGPFITVFPLPNLKPNSPQRINSIFDHTMSYQYCPSTDVNGHRTVMAYDGEEGSSQFGPGSQVGSKPFGCNPTGKYSDLFGYQNGQGAFDLYGEYYGAGTPDFLFYEGHPGYDYRAACHTQVLAAASGTVHYPTQIPGAGGAKFHILEIDPDATSTYKIYYLHLANWLSNNCIYSGKAQNCSCTYEPNVVTEGQHVNAGDPVGYSGDTGVPLNPHLHFEIQIQGLPRHPAGIPVDPYGWLPIPGISTQTDPYSRAVNMNLWNVE